MMNYVKAGHTAFFTSVLILSLSMLTLSLLSGCGDSNYTISGRLTLGGLALPGATIRLSGDAARETTTDANGRYSFGDVPTGEYTVTPSITGYIFVPTNLRIVVDGIDAPDIDFDATAQGRLSATNHTVYLANDGTVWTWGNNGNGQLGDGTTTDRSTPMQVGNLSGVIAIAAGGSHTVALKSDGTVWTWGDNSKGQLGIGSEPQSDIPVQVSDLSGITVIAAGDAHTLAVKNDGTAWAWGDNSRGQLGDGATVQKNKPVQVSTLTGIKAITAGSAHSIALRKEGTVWAWGDNTYGQLGTGNTTKKITPVRVEGISKAIAVSAGSSHTVALKKDGTVWAWGDNSMGQLGLGGDAPDMEKTPQQIAALQNVIAIEAGYSHTLALTVGGAAWAWGDNSYGQLGDGNITTTPAKTPEPITLPDDGH
jgi:alpha-tubulin suppressor-like RCC1 family protein